MARNLSELAFAMVLLCTGCPAPGTETETQPPRPDAHEASPVAPEPTAPPPDAPPPEVSQQDAQGVAAASNAFATDFWAKIRSRSGNLVVSPASIWVALEMTHAGARSATADEMARVLHVSGDGQAVRRAAGGLLAAWNDPARTAYTLRVANRLFGERSMRLEAPFVATMQNVFRAPLEPMDFKGAAEPSRARINSWVEQATDNRIHELLPATSIDEDTRLVLVNAVYFLAKWQAKFAQAATRAQPFWTNASASVSVPTMHQTEHFRYAEDAAVQVLQMPYEGGDLAMTIVLPRQRDGLATVEASLDAATIERWESALASTRVVVSLPKFTIEPAESLSLGDILESMGMPLAFDRGRADFSGMSVPPTPADRLYVSKVFHKAFVKVDEEGTEAAAATAVVMSRAGSAAPTEPPKQFLADHPFLFLLRDLRSGVILFAGRVADPR